MPPRHSGQLYLPRLGRHPHEPAAGGGAGWDGTPHPIILKQQPNGRMLSTREIGNAVAFLASDEASGITGTALYVDGGASAAI